MHRSIPAVRISALVLVCLLGAGHLGCKQTRTSTTTTVVLCNPGVGGASASTHPIDVSGGDAGSTGGTGGLGGFIGFEIWFGGAGSIEVSESGSVDASFVPTGSFSPDLGPNPLVVSGDLAIPVVLSAPPLGVPYLLEDDSSLYVSDGDLILGNEAPVTGFEVQAGATVTLGLNLSSNGRPAGVLTFSHDLVNDGTITVVDVDSEQRGAVNLYTDGDYIGRGGIETFGTLPGQDGGPIDVGALGRGYNSGAWLSYGADQTDGRAGNGGGIYFYTGFYNYQVDFDGEPGGLIENTGDMRSSGGAASGATGIGGSGGGIAILPYASLCNSGDLQASGGDGVGQGGDGGTIQVAGYYRGELRNTGDLTSDGGDATDDAAQFVYPGSGGEIGLGAAGADLRSSGMLIAHGGDASSEIGADYYGVGGSAIFFTGSSVDDYEERELDVPAGDIWVSGGVIATGGESLASDGTGGAGGGVFFYLLNDISEGTQAIHLLGFDGLTARGGDGESAGGDSVGLSFDLAAEAGVATGSVDVEPAMDSSGGNANPGVIGSQGGDAGAIAIVAGEIVYGTADASGGAGATPGADGSITPETGAP